MAVTAVQAVMAAARKLYPAAHRGRVVLLPARRVVLLLARATL
jgi:hypothetical protein